MSENKYQNDIAQNMPNFSWWPFDDIEQLQQRAAHLLNQQQGRVTLVGAPPQLAPEIYDSEAYFARKRATQGQKTHIAVSKVEDEIEKKKKSVDAKNVTTLLFINGQKQTLPNTAQGEQTFSTPFSQGSNAEIYASSGDAEVKPLTKAMACCKADLETNRESTARRVYELALIGPYGACDGCKDRIRAFKAQWKQLKAGSRGERVLVITYFYTHISESFRSNTSLYGWKEEQSAKTSNLTTYYYRSYNAS